MKKSLIPFVSLAFVITLFIGMYWIAGQSMKNERARPGFATEGNAAILATSSSINVGPGTNKNMLFTENTVCTSRVISTGANPILISFTAAVVTGTATSTLNPGPNIGFLQAASTTVSYDSNLYGCPAVSAYGYAASTTISIAEFR